MKVSARDALHIDELLDDLREGVVIESELSPQHPVGQASALFEVSPHLAKAGITLTNEQRAALALFS
jgi:hypothetical protein